MFQRIQLPTALAEYPKSNNRSIGRTVGDVIANVFPIGPDPTLGEDGAPRFTKGSEVDWTRAPATAPDLFAVTSHLLEISGAFSFYSAGANPPHEEQPVRLWLSSAETGEAVHVGDVWSNAYVEEPAPAAVAERWISLIEHWNWPINSRAYQATSCTPNWWAPAFFLFVTADEASKHVGFPVALEGVDQMTRNLANYFEYRDAANVKRKLGASGRRQLPNSYPSMCQFADPDVVCVQPKSLVSSVGGGTRVFSHHLANLRARGLVRTQWASATYSSKKDDSDDLNLLLVPMPYELSAENFKRYKNGSRKRPGATGSWRTFKVDQTWLRKLDPATHILQSIEQCESKGHDVHGVVLPELALNAEAYSRLSDQLADETNTEFLVSGCAQDCDGRDGNYVWCSRYDRDPTRKEGFETVFIQSKHHRWKLDKGQIKRYGIGKSLSEDYDWWEHINVGGRELNFASFRSNSVFSTIICEDLARSEPCHEILRSVGPNLLFALLMDGPQIEKRWPPRYSSYLSEDPGIAVLTLTSRGLIHLSDPESQNACVAHFRDGSGKIELIECPADADAVLLRLKSKPDQVEAIDGRSKKIVSWRLHKEESQIPIFNGH